MNTSTASLPAPLQLRAVLKDRAVQAVAVLLVLLAFADPPQLAASAAFVGASALGIAPVLLASAAAAAWILASGADRIVASAFRGHPARMVLTAALVGALSPFCSCGVIPIIAALLAMGVPLAPVMAFWISSPLMDPAMFFLTAGTLGLTFALAKALAAVAIGMLAGIGTMALVRVGAIHGVLREGGTAHEAGNARVLDPAAVAWKFWTDPARIIVFREAFGSKTLMLAKWLLVAFLLESLMSAYVPNEMIARIAGGSGFGPLLLAAFVGVPAYLNGYAALPLVAGLLQQGMSGGAAMAFLLAGGATSIPAALAVWSIVRPRVFAAYLGFAFTGAIIAGWVYGFLA
ncbi:MAG: permease [Burkholderiales bacterium]|nr:permease [Burkholderiales bacterium]